MCCRSFRVILFLYFFCSRFQQLLVFVLPCVVIILFRRVARTVWRGIGLGGPGVTPGGGRWGRAPRGGAGAEPLVPKIFDIFTENRPFRDLRVHDIGKSSQVECLCKTE